LFDVVFVESNKITLILPLKIWLPNQSKRTSEAAKKYIEAIAFFQNIETYRAKDIADA
jgi:sulfite reductase (ferredoxin)